MRWLTARIDTSHAGLEDLTAMLSGLGIDSVMIEDETEFQEFLEENRASWDYVDDDLINSMRNRSRVTFYLPDSEAGFSKLAEVRIALQALRESAQTGENNNNFLMTLENAEDADWENNWKKYYKPVEIGERLLIIPEWENHDCFDKNKNKIPVILDPGLAFGTGGHATTRMCLELLAPCVKGGERVLDLGCGSGILSIAALLLGAESAVAVDMDEIAVRVAKSNALLNQIQPDTARYRVFTGNINQILSNPKTRKSLDINQYHIIFANIVADVIIRIAPWIPDLLLPDGVFICSGVIDHRHEETESALKTAGFKIQNSRESGGWYAYQCAI